MQQLTALHNLYRPPFAKLKIYLQIEVREKLIMHKYKLARPIQAIRPWKVKKILIDFKQEHNKYNAEYYYTYVSAIAMRHMWRMIS